MCYSFYYSATCDTTSAVPNVNGICRRFDGGGVTRAGGVVGGVGAGGAAEAAGVELFMHVLSFNGINTTKMVKNEVMGLARVSQGAKTWVFAAEGMAAFAEAHAAAEEVSRC